MFSSVILEKGQVIAMVRYELKKVFGSVGGKIALILYIAVLALSCWLSSTGAVPFLLPIWNVRSTGVYIKTIHAAW